MWSVINVLELMDRSIDTRYRRLGVSFVAIATMQLDIVITSNHEESMVTTL